MLQVMEVQRVTRLHRLDQPIVKPAAELDSDEEAIKQMAKHVAKKPKTAVYASGYSKPPSKLVASAGGDSDDSDDSDGYQTSGASHISDESIGEIQPVVHAAVAPEFPTSEHSDVKVVRLKNGKKIFFGEALIGSLTFWASGASCKCEIHGGKQCKLVWKPGECPSDTVPIDWLLSCIDRHGRERPSLESHMTAKPKF